MDDHEHLVIITDRAGLAARPPGRAACVLAGPDDADLLEALAEHLPRRFEVGAALHSRRPLVHVDGDRIGMLTLVADGWESARRTYLAVSGDLLVVVGDAAARGPAEEAVTAAPDRPEVALAKVLAAVGRAAEAGLDAMSDAVTGAGIDSDRLIPVDARRAVSRQRARLAEWRQLYAGQARLLDDDEPLAEALAEALGDRHLLRPARGSFGYAAGVADRLYAVLGDLLSEQDALAGQRLTLVSTVFLPLTVSTGFFGMNFGWLTDNIGSFAAFVVLGVVVPVLFVLASLIAVRRFGV